MSIGERHAFAKPRGEPAFINLSSGDSDHRSNAAVDLGWADDPYAVVEDR